MASPTSSSTSENAHLTLLISSYSTRARASKYLTLKGYSPRSVESLLGRVGFPERLAYEAKATGA
jgi:hypothetical protein